MKQTNTKQVSNLAWLMLCSLSLFVSTVSNLFEGEERNFVIVAVEKLRNLISRLSLSLSLSLSLALWSTSQCLLFFQPSNSRSRFSRAHPSSPPPLPIGVTRFCRISQGLNPRPMRGRGEGTRRKSITRDSLRSQS